MTIIVFDFDDTLFATSFFLETKEQYKPDLARSADELVKTARRHGTVYIITNATGSWINQCCEEQLKDCPNILKTVEEGKMYSTVDHGFITLFSGPSKYKAFQHFLGSHFENELSSKQLISFGDMLTDREAALGIKEKYKDVAVKSVLMSPKPNFDELLKQHLLITEAFHLLHSYQGDLDLAMAVNKVPIVS